MDDLYDYLNPAARLYFLFARQAPVGVIFRRSPSKQVQLIRWNLDRSGKKPVIPSEVEESCPVGVSITQGMHQGPIQIEIYPAGFGQVFVFTLRRWH